MKKIILILLLISSSNIYATCLIKGNISYNGGTKYYFLPSHVNYPKVKINRAGERCFTTEVEAKKAGWRKAPKYNGK
jgi:uncharacterized protein YxeA